MSALGVIENYIYDNTSGFTILYENVDYRPDDNEKWMRLIVQHVSDVQETISGNRNTGIRENYLLMLQVFIPRNTGAKAVDDFANDIRTLLENADISNFIFGTVQINNIGPSESWFQKNIEVPFHIHR